jgi:Ca2+:H+ antiporter
VTVAAGVAHFAASDVAAFIVAGLALATLAWAVSFATEQLGTRVGPGMTGFLQSTLGNLPELFVVLFALSSGNIVVAQTSILGSLFANALLVLGMVIVVGARHGGGQMTFSTRLPNDTATLLLVATFIITVVSVSVTTGSAAADRVDTVSAVGAVCLLAVYGSWVFSYLRSDQRVELPDDRSAIVPLAVVLVILGIAGVGAALVSDWFIHSLEPAVDQLGISEAFAGLVIVAIAGNAVENFTGLVLASKGKYDLAISVVKNSVAQIAAFLFPVLVLASFLFAHHLTFALEPTYIGALLLTALAVWQITGDGEALIYEGVALLALYVVLAEFALAS